MWGNKSQSLCISGIQLPDFLAVVNRCSMKESLTINLISYEEVVMGKVFRQFFLRGLSFEGNFSKCDSVYR
jgi:hypothetical protein